MSKFIPYSCNCSLISPSRLVGMVPSLGFLLRTKAPLYSSMGFDPHQTTIAQSPLIHIHFQSSIYTQDYSDYYRDYKPGLPGGLLGLLTEDSHVSVLQGWTSIPWVQSPAPLLHTLSHCQHSRLYCSPTDHHPPV